LGRSFNDSLLRGLLEANTPAVLLSCQPSEGMLFGGVRPRLLPAGRALHITRRRTIEIQTAMVGEDGGAPETLA
jgi:S-DNA-T family DNA segregation ATPase FtsK/SpoIIIE